jgi:hypothetical protein
MKKILITVFISIIFLANTSIAQDSLLNKPIRIKKFDLTIGYKTNVQYQTGLKELQYDDEKTFEDCTKITPLTDSAFYIHFKSQKEAVLYKDITKISFKGKNNKVDGIFLGALGGFLSGLIFTYAIFESSHSDDKSGLAMIPIIAIPTFIVGGAIIGWTIGANTYERETFDISKYTPHERKDRAIKLFLKYKINL